MPRYVLSPRAHRDLEEIWNYTVERWGEEQAIRYAGDLREAIEAVARDPNRGQPCDEVRQGYRKHRVGSHILFYRFVPTGINIVRILHQGMDFERQLRKPSGQ